MPIILTILLLLIANCFGSTAVIWYPPSYQWYCTDRGCIVVRHGEYASYTWIMETDGTWRAYSKYQWTYVNGQWETQGIDIVADHKRFFSDEYTVQEMSHEQFLMDEMIPGWMGNDPNRPSFDLRDLKLLAHHSKWVIPEPNIPDEPEVTIDPNAVAILGNYIGKASPDLIAEVMAALARGDDLMQSVSIYKYLDSYYHRAACTTLPRGRYAVGTISTLPLIEAILQGKQPCDQCKPPTLGDQ